MQSSEEVNQYLLKRNGAACGGQSDFRRKFHNQLRIPPNWLTYHLTKKRVLWYLRTIDPDLTLDQAVWNLCEGYTKYGFLDVPEGHVFRNEDFTRCVAYAESVLRDDQALDELAGRTRFMHLFSPTTAVSATHGMPVFHPRADDDPIGLNLYQYGRHGLENWTEQL